MIIKKNKIFLLDKHISLVDIEEKGILPGIRSAPESSVGDQQEKSPKEVQCAHVKVDYGTEVKAGEVGGVWRNKSERASPGQNQ